MTALQELREQVAAGVFPAGPNDAARKVFPYSEAVGWDYGVVANCAFDGSIDALIQKEADNADQ